MTVKNAVAKRWTNVAGTGQIIPSFDGRRYSKWRDGDKPAGAQTAPTLIALDLVAGSLTGGESNKGAYLTAFVYGCGRQADLGQSTGAQILFRDPLGDNAWHGADNYRYLITSRTFSKTQALEIGFQIGALTGSGTAAGRVLDVKMTVNGVDSNILSAYFTVQPGRFFFISKASGNDTTGVIDDITHPFAEIQVDTSAGNGTSYSGVCAVTVPTGGAGFRGGDTMVLMDSTPWTSNLGADSRFFRFRIAQHAGTAPDGTVGHGYVNFVRYPGTIGGHAPHAPTWNDPASGRGGFNGIDSGHAGTAGSYVAISGLTLVSSPTSTRTDGAPINLQQESNFWRVVNNDVSWNTTTIALSGGIVGQGDNVFVAFNKVHDVNCDQSSMTNHGVYIGSGSQTQVGTAIVGPASDAWEVCYNWITNIVGGSGLQWNQTNSADTFKNHLVHHNWIETTGKNGVTGASCLESAKIWNNVIIGACVGPQNGASFKISDNIASRAVHFVHNTIVQKKTTGAYPALIVNDGANDTSGTINIKYNVLCLDAAHDASLTFTTMGAGDTAVAMDYNQYFDFAGTVVSVPSKDGGHGAYGNPLFTDKTNSDYTLATSSPCLNAVTVAEPIAITTDLYGFARPQTGTGVPSVTFNDYGAFEGIGT